MILYFNYCILCIKKSYLGEDVQRLPKGPVTHTEKWRTIGAAGGVRRQSTESVQGSEAALCDAGMVAACPYTCVQTPGAHSAKSGPDVKCRLWVQWRVNGGSSIVTNVPSGGGVDSGEAVPALG